MNLGVLNNMNSFSFEFLIACHNIHKLNEKINININYSS